MTKDLTKGSPFKLILTFMVPVLIGNIFQQLYNMADTLIVGHTVSSDAMAGVGAYGGLRRQDQPAVRRARRRGREKERGRLSPALSGAHRAFDGGGHAPFQTPPALDADARQVFRLRLLVPVCMLRRNRRHGAV